MRVDAIAWKYASLTPGGRSRVTMGMPGVMNTSQFRSAFSEVCSITMSPMFRDTDAAGLPSESGTLKMNKPDRIAHAQIDRDESKVCATLHTIPRRDGSAIAGHHSCGTVDPCHELTRIDRMKPQSIGTEVLQHLLLIQ